MQIDWWTLALQTINVVILVWLLARFFFKPVSAIIDERQKAAQKTLDDAEDARKAAAKARDEASAMRDKIADQRQALIAEAKEAAKSERDVLVAQTNTDLEGLRSKAETELARERTAAETELVDRAGELSVTIAKRLLRRMPPNATWEAFLAGLCAEIEALPPRARTAFVSAEQDGEAIKVVTPAALDGDQRKRLQEAVEAAFGAKLSLSFDSDPTLIAGIELRGRSAVVGNSWKNDLETIGEELKRDGERSGATEELARPGKVDG